MRPVLPRLVAVAAAVFGLNAAWAVLLLSYSERDQKLVVPLAVILFAAGPIAWGLFQLKRPYFTATLVHGIATLAIGTATALFVEHTSHLIWAAIAQSALVTAFFLQPNVRAPFLRERKGFRRFRRIETSLKVSLEIIGQNTSAWRSGETFDVSLGGAYLIVESHGLTEDSRVKVNIELRAGKTLRIPARITNVSPEGFGPKPAGLGVEFTSLSRYDKSMLEVFIAGGRNNERIPVQLPVSFERQGNTVMADTLDVSMSGCYVLGPHTTCAPGDRLSLTLMLHDEDPLELLGEVMWMSLTDSQGKPPGLAIHFMDITRADRRRLEERLKEAGIEPN